MNHAAVGFGSRIVPGGAVLCVFLFALVSSLTTMTMAAEGPARIVALGDIHGAFDELVFILRETKLIDANHRWWGGNATLVVTGDFLDRGPKGREVLDLLMALEEEAPKDGGRVVVLLGNHEVMNLVGDLRYMTSEAYAEFAGRDAEERRQTAYKAYTELGSSAGQTLKSNTPKFKPKKEKAWMKTHPPGFIEHREAFGPEGKYGRWLRGLPAVAQVGDVIFVHGGIHPALSTWNLDRINKRVWDEIEVLDAYRRQLVERKLILPFFTLGEVVTVAEREIKAHKAAVKRGKTDRTSSSPPLELTPQEIRHRKALERLLHLETWLIFEQNGPLWFRGYALWPEREATREIVKLLESFSVAHFVVGHTALLRDGRIHTRLGGKVFLIDTGMLRSFFKYGRPSALEIRNGRFTAIYPDRQKVLLDRSPANLPSRE